MTREQAGDCSLAWLLLLAEGRREEAKENAMLQAQVMASAVNAGMTGNAGPMRELMKKLQS